MQHTIRHAAVRPPASACITVCRHHDEITPLLGVFQDPLGDRAVLQLSRDLNTRSAKALPQPDRRVIQVIAGVLRLPGSRL